MASKQLTETEAAPTRLAVLLVGSPAAVALNLLFGTVIGYLALPYLFLDTIGTFVASAAFGFWSGAAVGLLANLLLTLTIQPKAIYFIPVQIAIAGIVAG